METPRTAKASQAWQNALRALSDAPAANACTFCRKSAEAVPHIIAAPERAALICDQCIDECATILAEHRLKKQVRDALDEIFRTVEPDEIGKPKEPTE
jgi:hypothetical protein